MGTISSFDFERGSVESHFDIWRGRLLEAATAVAAAEGKSAEYQDARKQELANAVADMLKFVEDNKLAAEYQEYLKNNPDVAQLAQDQEQTAPKAKAAEAGR